MHRAYLRCALYTHPEASVLGLSEDDIYDALVMRCESDGTPCEPEVLSNFARCIYDLTRASAATLPLPPTTGLPQAAYCASAATQANEADK